MGGCERTSWTSSARWTSNAGAISKALEEVTWYKRAEEFNVELVRDGWSLWDVLSNGWGEKAKPPS